MYQSLLQVRFICFGVSLMRIVEIENDVWCCCACTVDGLPEQSVLKDVLPL